MQSHDALKSLVLTFEQLPPDAASLAGGKGACLGRISDAGLNVPRGYVVCTTAFDAFLECHAACSALAEGIRNIDVDDSVSLAAESERIRILIEGGAMPTEIANAVHRAYVALGSNVPVAVRSSAVGEDGEAASFAGQQETFLNVTGGEDVIARVKQCWASFFSPRALMYRFKKGAVCETRMAVVVQVMAFGEKSGVMFTVDPVQKRTDRMVIEAVFGLGEGIVSGLITPNQYVIDRDDCYLLDEFILPQRIAIVPGEHGGAKEVELIEAEAQRRVLNEGELNCLRHMGLELEALFGRPQDVEWCICGRELFVLQSRPITAI